MVINLSINLVFTHTTLIIYNCDILEINNCDIPEINNCDIPEINNCDILETTVTYYKLENRKQDILTLVVSCKLY